MTWILPVALGVALVAILMLLRRPRRPIVIGAQLATASAAEERRLARTDLGPTPMPPGGYSAVEANLNAPVPSSFDAELRRVVRRYAGSDANTRAGMRDATSMDELYTLITFASRQTVFAMREHAASHIDDALAALAMLDIERVDWRDAARTIDLVLCVAARFGNAEARFERAAVVASEAMASSLRERVGRPSPTLEDCLYEEISTGLIDRGIEDYAPAHDLVTPILAIADLLRKEETDVSVSIAEDLPAIWVGGNQSLVASSSGTATVQTGFSEEQSLMASLSEMIDAANAQEVAAAARAVEARDWAVAAIARENLVCLVIARAFVVGVPNEETDQSLSRFERPIAAILDAAVSAG